MGEDSTHSDRSALDDANDLTAMACEHGIKKRIARLVEFGRMKQHHSVEEAARINVSSDSSPNSPNNRQHNTGGPQEVKCVRPSSLFNQRCQHLTIAFTCYARSIHRIAHNGHARIKKPDHAVVR